MESRNKPNKMVRRLEQIIRKGVKNYLKSVERPYVLFLSGGIDSAFLAYLTKPDIVLTCKLPYGKKYDEFADSQKVAKHLGLKQITITPTKKQFFKYLPEAVRAHKPTYHFSLEPLYLLFKRVSELGYTNILSAQGLDEYLGGYTSYLLLMNEQRLYDQPELKNYSSLINRYIGTPQERLARVMGIDVKKVKRYWGNYKHFLSNIGKADLKLRGIEDMEQDLAKHWGVKIHYPFMVKETEEFCFKYIPDDMKIKGFTIKWILRKIAEKYLPKSVIWRKNKMGGPMIPIGKWLGEKDEFSKNKYMKLQQKYA